MLQLKTRPHRGLQARLHGPYKRTLALLLAAALALPAHSLAAPTPAHGDSTPRAPLLDRTERERRLTQTLAAIADLRKTLNRAEFDTEALLESLDYDPEAIIDFVRDEIRFEPYEGLLRGPQGTLMSRAGNALDQSLLLAALLQEAGADARLAHGMLDVEQAMQLVRSLRGQPTPVPSRELPGVRPHIEKIAHAAAAGNAMADAIMQLMNDAREPQELPIWAAAKVGRDYLQEHLDRANITLEPTDAEPQLAAQSVSYFWVEYKDGAAASWQRVHAIPAGDAFAEQSLPVLEYFADAVPERFQHRLRFTAKLERQVSGKTEIVELMQPWERPVANMAGKRLTFANHPNGIRSLQDLDDLSMIEARTTLLIPTLNDAPAPGAQAFDLRGRTIALSTLHMSGSQAAAFFQTTSEKHLEAADALAGLSFGNPKAQANTTAYSLNRIWLEYTSIHPDGSERVDERTIWQASESMTSAALPMLWELATPHGIGVATSEYPANYLLDFELARLQSLEPLLRWTVAAQGAPAGQPLPRQPDLDPAASGFPELSYLSQFDAGIDTDASGLLAYRAEPTIVVTRHGLRNTKGETSGFADVDIVHNRRTVLRTDASSVKTDPLQAMRLGTWETLVEQAELENRLPMLLAAAPSTIISANRMYQEPQHRTQMPLILHRLDDLAALPVDSLEGSSLLAIEQDLRRGYVVAMETPARPQSLMWWRVNPATGETLGRGLDGRGQITVEGVVIAGIAVHVSTVVGTGMCYASSNSCSFVECLVTANLTASAGAAIGLGGAAAMALGTAAAVVGGALALSVGLITHPVMNALPNGGLIPSCFR